MGIPTICLMLAGLVLSASETKSANVHLNNEEIDPDSISLNVEIDAPPILVWNVLTHPDHAKIIGSEFDKGAFMESEWKLGSKVYFKYDPDRIVATGIISKLIEGELIEVDYNFNGFAYEEKFTLKSNKEGTLLQVDAGPYLQDFEAHNKVWKNWLHKVKELSENLENNQSYLTHMKHLEFTVHINAPTEKVYSTMIDETHFKAWTSVFNPNTYFEGSWDKGSKIVFIGPDEKGILHGLICTIKENIPNKEIYIQPYGIMENGVEITEGKKVEGLDQSYENYFFNQKGDATELVIKVAVYNELEEYFMDTWPKALDKLKSICEVGE